MNSHEYLEISDNDGDDPVSDGFEVADAIDFLGEYFMEEAFPLHEVGILATILS